MIAIVLGKYNNIICVTYNQAHLLARFLMAVKRLITLDVTKVNSFSQASQRLLSFSF
jgi:hypothetical protein